MTLVAVRINSIVGEVTWNEDTGEPEEGDWEFNDSEEDIVYIETDDDASMHNGVSDILEALAGWNKYHA